MKRNSIILALAISIFLVPLLFGNKVNAYTVAGRGEYYGYFTNKYDIRNNGDTVLPGYNKYKKVGDTVGSCISGSGTNGTTTYSQADYNADRAGNSIPLCVDSVPEFMKFLKTSSDNSSVWRQTGAAYIVHTMLGRNGSSGLSKQIAKNSSDWNKLQAILNEYQEAKLIDWHVGELSNNIGSGVCVNTYARVLPGGDGDISWLNECKTQPGIKIINPDQTLAYGLWRSCANPVGRLRIFNWGLDLKSAVVVGTGSFEYDRSASNPKQANVGNTVRWKYEIKNIKSDTTNKDINYGYYHWRYKDGKWVSKKQIYVGTIPFDGGLAYNNVLTYYSPPAGTDRYVVQEEDKGSMICRKTYASKQSSVNYSEDTSNWSCINVNIPTTTEEWHIDPTAEIFVNGVSKGKATKDAGLTIEATPTQKITWDIKVTNKGTNSTDEEIKYQYINANDLIDRAHGKTGGKVYEAGFLNSGESASTITYLYDKKPFIINTTDYGKTFCRHTLSYSVSKANSDDGNTNNDTIASKDACVTVKWPEAGFDLYPEISLDPNTSAVEPGENNLNVNPLVNNNGTIGSANTYWQITRLVDKPAFSTSKLMIGGTSISTTTPESFFTGWDEKVNIKFGTGVFEVGDNSLEKYDESGLVFEAGSQVCYVLSVRPYSNSESGWRHSDPVCVTVGKKPKVQIWGGDVRTLKDVKTSLSNFMNNTFGSWSEYAILASGTISNMGSGSVLNGLGQPDICARSVLGFTNAGESTCPETTEKGSYAINSGQPSVAASFPVSGSTPVIGSDSLSSVSGLYKTTGDIELNGGTISANKWVVINASEYKVTINGDIKYSNTQPLHGISEIPQLVIIAGNIDIKDDVKQIDGWLVAPGGTINTCANITNLLTTNCTEQLRINGPVIADRLLLRRTHGSELNTNDSKKAPAEIINLRADSYLWAASQAQNSNRMRTVYTVELPPRF